MHESGVWFPRRARRDRRARVRRVWSQQGQADSAAEGEPIPQLNVQPAAYTAAGQSPPNKLTAVDQQEEPELPAAVRPAEPADQEVS